MRHQSQANKTEKVRLKSGCNRLPTRVGTEKVCRIVTSGVVCWTPGLAPQLLPNRSLRLKEHSGRRNASIHDGAIPTVTVKRRPCCS